jgi:hypothetical protein
VPGDMWGVAEWAVPLPREAYAPVVVASMNVTVTFSRYMRQSRAMCDRLSSSPSQLENPTWQAPEDPHP